MNNTLNVTELGTKTRDELVEIAKQLNLSGCSSMKKDEMVIKLMQTQAEQQGQLFVSGILETVDDGYGF